METQETQIAKQGFVPADAKKIEAFKMVLSAIKTIANDSELERANIAIKDAKQYFKEVENQRKSFTLKLDAIKQSAMVYEKELKEAFSPVEILTSNYLRKKEEARLAEQAKIEEEARKKVEAEQLKGKHKQNLLDYEYNSKKAISEATKKTIVSVKEKLSEFKPSEQTFGENIEEAKKLKKELLKLCDKQEEAIKSKKELDIDLGAIETKKAEAELESVAKLEEIDLKAQAASQNLGSTAGIKRLWTFETVDVTKVPKEYLIVDEVKVNALIKSGVREVAGLRIFQDISRSGR